MSTYRPLPANRWRELLEIVGDALVIAKDYTLSILPLSHATADPPSGILTETRAQSLAPAYDDIFGQIYGAAPHIHTFTVHTVHPSQADAWDGRLTHLRFMPGPGQHGLVVPNPKGKPRSAAIQFMRNAAEGTVAIECIKLRHDGTARYDEKRIYDIWYENRHLGKEDTKSGEHIVRWIAEYQDIDVWYLHGNLKNMHRFEAKELVTDRVLSDTHRLFGYKVCEPEMPDDDLVSGMSGRLLRDPVLIRGSPLLVERAWIERIARVGDVFISPWIEKHYERRKGDCMSGVVYEEQPELKEECEEWIAAHPKYLEWEKTHVEDTLMVRLAEKRHAELKEGIQSGRIKKRGEGDTYHYSRERGNNMSV